jgi:hypothetical protein
MGVFSVTGDHPMSPEKPERSRPRSKRFGVEFEEERAWVAFYRRVGSDPAIATEVLAQLDADADMKRRHLALYLCCKESLRSHKLRQARNKRVGQFVRWLCHGLFLRPIAAVRVYWRHSRDLAVECLPEGNREPAAPQVRRLKAKTEFAQAHSDFDALVASSTATSGSAQAGAGEDVPRFGSTTKAG